YAAPWRAALRPHQRAAPAADQRVDFRELSAARTPALVPRPAISRVAAPRIARGVAAPHGRADPNHRSRAVGKSAKPRQERPGARPRAAARSRVANEAAPRLEDRRRAVSRIHERSVAEPTAVAGAAGLVQVDSQDSIVLGSSHWRAREDTEHL